MLFMTKGVFTRPFVRLEISEALKEVFAQIAVGRAGAAGGARAAGSGSGSGWA